MIQIALQITFTNLTPTRLEQELTTLGTPAGDDAIRDWLDQKNLRLRKIRKSKPGGRSPDCDAQFQNIDRLIAEYRQTGNPCFSVDTKAQEFQGQLFRQGRIRCTKGTEKGQRLF